MQNNEEEMYLKLTEDLLQIYDNGTLYGRKSDKNSTSYSMNNHFATLSDEYKAGKGEGLSYSVVHTMLDIRRVVGLHIYKTNAVGVAYYTPIEESRKYISLKDLEEFINSNRFKCSSKELSIRFRKLVNSQKRNTSNAMKNTIIKEYTIFDFL